MMKTHSFLALLLLLSAALATSHDFISTERNGYAVGDSARVTWGIKGACSGTENYHWIRIIDSSGKVLASTRLGPFALGVYYSNTHTVGPLQTGSTGTATAQIVCGSLNAPGAAPRLSSTFYFGKTQSTTSGTGPRCGSDCTRGFACSATQTPVRYCQAGEICLVSKDADCPQFDCNSYQGWGVCMPDPNFVNSVSISPASATVQPGKTQQFSASCKNADGGSVSCGTLTWTRTIGSISSGGLLSIASNFKGSGTVTVRTTTGKTSSASVTVPPVLTSVSIAPNPTSTTTGTTKQFTPTCKDQTGAVMTCPAGTWATNLGSVSNAGLYTAPSTAGTATVTATIGGKAASATVTVSGGVIGGGGSARGVRLLYKVGDTEVALEEVIGVAALVFVVLLVVYNFALGGKLGEAPARRARRR
jgi:hypothetical protein